MSEQEQSGRKTPPHMRDEAESDQDPVGVPSTAGHREATDEHAERALEGDSKETATKQRHVGDAVRGALKGFIDTQGKNASRPTVGTVDIHPDIGTKSLASQLLIDQTTQTGRKTDQDFLPGRK